MPNRILRDWTDSEKMNSLDVHTERFFTRLIMKVDDYGRFTASVKLLRSNLYPLLIDQIREADITRWMAACQKAGLIALYEVESKPYLQIENFNQRLRLKIEKHPRPTHDGHVTDIRPPEVESGIRNPETGNNTAQAPPKTMDEKKEVLRVRAEKFKDTLRPFLGEYQRPMLDKFFDYWSECNPSYTKLRFEMEKTWEVKKRLATWAERDRTFIKPTGNGQNNNVRKGQSDTGAIREVARRILEESDNSDNTGGD